MAEVRVSKASELQEGQTLTFQYQTPYLSAGSSKLHSHQGVVIRHKGQLLAFENSCPHWSVELDLGDEHFFDAQLDRIYCKNHGALFVLPSGLCETGPCLGRGLNMLTLREDGGDVVVTV